MPFNNCTLFYIFLYNFYNYYIISITESLGKNIVSSQIKGETIQGTPCYIWTQIFDCKDGSFIVRYRTYNTCFRLHITLKINDHELPIKHSQFVGKPSFY